MTKVLRSTPRTSCHILFIFMTANREHRVSSVGQQSEGQILLGLEVSWTSGCPGNADHHRAGLDKFGVEVANCWASVVQPGVLSWGRSREPPGLPAWAARLKSTPPVAGR